jgi:hypothetical protein
MTKYIDAQKVEEQGYQVELIHNLVDIAQDNTASLNESLIKYKNHEFDKDELILDLQNLLPKIDALLKVVFDKTDVTKDALYKLVLDSLHDDKEDLDND